MTIKTGTTKLEQFRQQLYQTFTNRADTLMELVDAICRNPQAAQSVVEYSLTACFRRSYSTIFKAIFTLMQVIRYDEKDNLACKRPRWLLAIGQRRHDLSAQVIYQAYGQRYDLEHFFRFGKQKMLLASFQTPEAVREEKWWRLVHLAYAQLWMARRVTCNLPNP